VQLIRLSGPRFHVIHLREPILVRVAKLSVAVFPTENLVATEIGETKCVRLADTGGELEASARTSAVIHERALTASDVCVEIGVEPANVDPNRHDAGLDEVDALHLLEGGAERVADGALDLADVETSDSRGCVGDFLGAA